MKEEASACLLFGDFLYQSCNHIHFIGVFVSVIYCYT